MADSELLSTPARIYRRLPDFGVIHSSEKTPTVMRLQVVTLVLQLHEGVSALEHVSDVISSYLGPPPNLSLARACTFGSTPLLDWIWESSCTTEVDRKPNWTLTNYLRSEIRYGEWQFNEPMVVAAQRGNLAILQWLLDHYSECSVDKTVVEAAAQAGRCNFYTNKVPHLVSHPGEPTQVWGAGECAS